MVMATEYLDTTTDSLLTIAVRPSPLGCVAVLFEDERLLRVTIGHATVMDAARAIDEPHAQVALEDDFSSVQRELIDRLAAALGGEEVDFADVDVDLSHLGPFARRVAQRCRAIPSGETMTYAELAAACGSPAAARAVGNVMAGNRYPLIVPCHRVVGARGSLGGFSAPNGVAFKRRLLELEGALA